MTLSQNHLLHQVLTLCPNKHNKNQKIKINKMLLISWEVEDLVHKIQIISNNLFGVKEEEEE